MWMLQGARSPRVNDNAAEYSFSIVSFDAALCVFDIISRAWGVERNAPQWVMTSSNTVILGSFRSKKVHFRIYCISIKDFNIFLAEITSKSAYPLNNLVQYIFLNIKCIEFRKIAK